MKTMISILTASIPSPLLRSPATDHTSVTDALFLRRSRITKLCLHLDIHPTPNPLSHARSDTDLARSITLNRISSSYRLAPPAEDVDEETEDMFLESSDLWRSSSSVVVPEETEYADTGIGKGSKIREVRYIALVLRYDPSDG